MCVCLNSSFSSTFPDDGHSVYCKFNHRANSLTLEYALAVWDLHQQGLINPHERVQKFALKMCTKNWGADYGSLLQSCNLSTLASRRNCLKLCFLHQIINGHLFFQMRQLGDRTCLIIWVIPVLLHFRGLLFTQMPTCFHSFHTPLHCGILSLPHNGESLFHLTSSTLSHALVVLFGYIVS